MKKVERTFTQIIQRFFKPVFAYKKESLKAAFPIIVTSFITIYLVYLLKDITNLLQKGIYDEAITFLIIFSVLAGIKLIITIVTINWTHAVLWPTYRKYGYKNYINRFITLDNNETEKLGTGKLVALVDKGMLSWVDLIVRFFLEILPTIIIVVLSFILIATVSLQYLGIVVFFFILIFSLTIILQGKSKKYRDKRKDLNVAITRRFVKVLMSKFEILQNDKSQQELDNIANSLDKNIALNKKIGIFRIPTEFFLNLLIDGSKVLVILFLGLGFFGQEINLGEFVSLLGVIYLLDNMLTRSLYNYIEFIKIYVEIEKFWDLFDTTPKISGYEEGSKFIYKNGDIELKQINYGYSEGKPVFKDFDLNVSGGKITALVGNSGGGKSTLVKLISGYIKADSGDIIIDGQKLSETSLKTYYKDIGYLTQEPSVFDGTVLDNLTYAIERELKKGELEEVLKMAKCDFVYDLQDGIDTEIGERGVRLSGGQKQRLAIAKIFLKNPKIIILDEPTSALDSFSEEDITKAMNNLFKDRTVIVIAHRLQTVKHANDIIFLDNGKIIERGTHQELVKQKGAYKKMLDLQSGF